MLESGVAWIEALTQMAIVIPFCFAIQKTTGYRKIWRAIPSWVPAAVIYSIWNAYNVIVLRYPEIITDIISEPVAYKVRAVSGLIVEFVILPWFYNGSVIERYFVWFLIEIISLFSGFFRYVVWILVSANNGLYDYLNENLFLMLIFRLVAEIAPYFLLCFIFKKQLKQYRIYVDKHEKICYTVVILIIGIEIVSAFLTVSNNFQQILRETAGTAFLFTVMGIMIYFLKRENEQMYLQKQFLENHYQSVKNQEEQIAEMQSEIGKLLKAASTLEEQMRYSEADLKYYSDELKNIYKKLSRVDYCDNLVLDAVLYNKAKECEEKNITLDIEAQDMKLGKIQDLDIFEVMYAMLEIAIDQAQMQEDEVLRHITISGKNLAGQVVVEVSFPSVLDQSVDSIKQYRRLRTKVRRLGGQCIRNGECKIENIIVGIMC